MSEDPRRQPQALEPSGTPPAGRAAQFLHKRSVVEGEWFRVHPVTPLLTGWKVIAVVVAIITAQNLRWVVDEFTWQRALIGVGALTVLIVIATAFGVLSWWFTRYRLTERSFERRTGWLFRAEKSAELDRIQTIEIQRPLVARLAGFASVTVEVAGGSGSNFSVEYLRVEDADFLRAVLLEATHRASGRGRSQAVPDVPATDSAPDPAPAPASPLPGPPMLAGEDLPWQRAALERDETEIATVPVQRLLLSSVLNLGVLVTVALVIVGLIATAIAELLFDAGPGAGVLAGAVPAGIAIVSASWQHLNRGWNYRAVVGESGLRITGGLADTTARNIPPGRVQAVTISQPVLWRRFGWWRLNVTIAGVGDSAEDVSARWTLPVGTQEQALRFLDHLVPPLGLDDPAGVIRSGMTGKHRDGGFRIPARPSRFLDPIAYPRLGYLSTPTLLLLRSGRLERSLTLIPHERPQSVRLTSGPIERALGMATVSFDIAGAGIFASIYTQVPHLATADAEDLFASEAAIGATARRYADRSSWDLPAASVPDPRADPDILDR